MAMQADLQASGSAAHGPAAAGDDYRVRDAGERLALLNELRDGRTPVLMHAPGGHALRATLWAVDAGAARLGFTLSAAELAAPHLPSVLEADEVSAVAHPGHMKLQFELNGLVLVRGRAGTLLQAALPEELLRIQRRESFRVTPPVAAPVAYLRHPALPEMSLALRVLDVSLGGCSLRLPDDVPRLEPGTRIAGVTVELDVNTRLRVELTLQHLTHIFGGEDTGRVASARIGCEWRLARVADERALQRWIDQAQVRRRLQQRSRAAEPHAPQAAAAGPAEPHAPAQPAASAAPAVPAVPAVQTVPAAP